MLARVRLQDKIDKSLHPFINSAKLLNFIKEVQYKKLPRLNTNYIYKADEDDSNKN